MINLILCQDNEICSFQHILAHNFRKTIGGATSTEIKQDFDLPHKPTKFHKNPSKIKDAGVSTRFTRFGLYIT